MSPNCIYPAASRDELTRIPAQEKRVKTILKVLLVKTIRLKGHMKYPFILLLISLWLISCNKDEPNTPTDLSPGVNWIKVESSSYTIPFNGTGIATLTAISSSGDQLYDHTAFYVNDQKLDKIVFTPKALGTYSIYARYKDLTSTPIEIKVENPLNKKVLIESFTSRICGFCPWIGARLDSLDDANSNVISYSIHGQDELEVSETYPLQQLLSVYARPSVRINRGYVRNFDAFLEINELVDSVQYFLSSQPRIELSIESAIHQQNITVKVDCKYFEEIKDDIYLSLMLVEDSVITQNQYNYFSGYPWTYCPFAALPDSLSNYSNHNVLRKVITDTNGDMISKTGFVYGKTQEIGSYTFSVDTKIDLSKASLIAIVHRRQAGIEISTVLNAQQVKVGENIGFDE